MNFSVSGQVLKGKTENNTLPVLLIDIGLSLFVNNRQRTHTRRKYFSG